MKWIICTCIVAVSMPAMAEKNFYPGGVVDETNLTLYSVSTAGPVQVINLKDGSVTGTFAGGNFPIDLNLDGLLAAKVVNDTNEKGLSIINLNPLSGEVLAQSSVLSFPDWVPVSLGFSRGAGSFSTQFSVDQGIVTLDWQAHTQYSGGAAPPPWVQLSSSNRGVGEFKVSMAKTHFPTGLVVASWECSAHAGGDLPCKMPLPQPGAPSILVGDEYILARLTIGPVTYMEVEAQKPVGGGTYGSLPISVRAVDTASQKVLYTTQVGEVHILPPRP